MEESARIESRNGTNRRGDRASRDRRKYGNKALRAFRDAGETVIPSIPASRTWRE